MCYFFISDRVTFTKTTSNYYSWVSAKAVKLKVEQSRDKNRILSNTNKQNVHQDTTHPYCIVCICVSMLKYGLRKEIAMHPTICPCYFAICMFVVSFLIMLFGKTHFIYHRGVKHIFTKGHISKMAALKGPTVKQI
ncbi:hypothetical protein NQD34_016854 [Periophthalmus magnuspinnatus]|nr:hypothetical protein NQD34_016854 [Periophthalmus magnuspinnatus]